MSAKILQFWDDTATTSIDEFAFRKKVTQLVFWFSLNYMLLNTQETAEMGMDFRCKPVPYPLQHQ